MTPQKLALSVFICVHRWLNFRFGTLADPVCRNFSVLHLSVQIFPAPRSPSATALAESRFVKPVDSVDSTFQAREPPSERPHRTIRQPHHSLPGLLSNPAFEPGNFIA